MKRLVLVVAAVSGILAACGETAVVDPYAGVTIAIPVDTGQQDTEDPLAGMADYDTLRPEERAVWLWKMGAYVYNTGGTSGIGCVTCHMEDGRGQPPAYPPFAGRQKPLGGCAEQADAVVRGIQGELVIDEVTYLGVMPAQPALTDIEIAAVLTYIRSAWDNEFGTCLPEDVAAVR